VSRVSLHHEAPLEILRRVPGLAIALLRTLGPASAADVAIRTTEVQRVDTELNEAKPAVYQADFVAILRDASGEPTAVVVIEVQRDIEPNKLKTWANYVTYLVCRNDVPVFLLVIATSDDVARWAAGPHEVSPQFSYAPAVLTAERLREARMREGIESDSAFAALSVVINPSVDEETTQDTVRSLVEPPTDSPETRDGTNPLIDESLRRLFVQLIFDVAHTALKATLQKLVEGKMDIQEVIRMHQRDEGRAEGRAEGKARSLLVVLQVRGIEVDKPIESRIHGGTDDELEDWLRRAVTAETIEDVFAER
jgi:hypothetical protein